MAKNVLALGLVATILTSPFVLVACTGNVSHKTESQETIAIVEETEQAEIDIVDLIEERPFAEGITIRTIVKVAEEKETIYELWDEVKDEVILILHADEAIKFVGAESGLNLRNYPTKEEYSLVKAIPYAAEVEMIADSDEGWSIVKYDGVEYLCWGDMLVDEEPAPLKKTPTVVYVDNKYEEVETSAPTTEPETEEYIHSACAYYTPSQLKSMGVIYWNGWKWTWYSQRVLPGGGLQIPGRHVDENGYVCDENGYICLAASSLSKGTVVDTPFGKMGKVYDTGCAYGVLDVYTDF